jgi:hypothetical protein
LATLPDFRFSIAEFRFAELDCAPTVALLKIENPKSPFANALCL